MIVKNEEKNIERALTWGKNIVCEQVVVDTGSTDRTVEIAERMGAKVFHFEWINDFSAAKNFALSKAKGNWIVFLDADEYFSDEDALLLLEILKATNQNTSGTSMLLPIAQLGDEGQVNAVLTQQRVFKNSLFKYVGRIHERLAPAKAGIASAAIVCNDITILHTGYTHEAYATTNKLARNVEMLNRELELNPDDPNIMAYLADSLLTRRASPDDLIEARRLYIESLLGEKKVDMAIRMNAYTNFLMFCQHFDTDLYYRAAEQAVKDFPHIGLFSLHYGLTLYLKEDYDRAWEYLRKAEDFLKGNEVRDAQGLPFLTSTLFEHLLKCAEAKNDKQAMIKYAVLVLRGDKSQLGVLEPLIGMFQQSGIDDDAILDILRKIYNFEDPRDVITAAKGAAGAGAEELMERLKETANSLLDASV
jgi:glycosyltransferase involved in cell wall biosynthesis